ncbi:conserved hypothetical protein [Cupriavidus taiwanensis]|uniref:hypothetical protein n=1 Tax=Cupriavidus taiwanensis TaxID=164546 RepID=UPI000E18EAA2|nr:hypothetical protein [Cupriavidus taiwanensis]SOZ19422.1 conserved hypothetical protein [Cupriavidus taiwanensis]SOZ32619.1 conserved hypothetical protein [Cupriavidus taiwanensis]SOZ48216.1 conserved hypothetical protein [Cupriavidus taiwanensis]
MLSHHEIATLVLVNDHSDATELDDADMQALLERQFITLERLGPTLAHPQVTIQGYAFLKAVGRVRASDSKARQQTAFRPSL